MIYLKSKLRWDAPFPLAITYSGYRSYTEVKVTFHFYLLNDTKVYALTAMVTPRLSMQCTTPHIHSVLHVSIISPLLFTLTLDPSICPGHFIHFYTFIYKKDPERPIVFLKFKSLENFLDCRSRS